MRENGDERVKDEMERLDENEKPQEFYPLAVKTERVLGELKKRGYRITRQRRLLMDIILSGRFSSSKEIYYQAVKEDSGVGIATVYRMLGLLEEIGAISRKEIHTCSSETVEIFRKKCTIVLDDCTKYQLSGEEWGNVVKRGLSDCGYLEENHAVAAIILEKDEN